MFGETTRRPDIRIRNPYTNCSTPLTDRILSMKIEEK